MNEGAIDWCIHSIEITYIGDCEIRFIVIRRAAFWGFLAVTGTKDVRSNVFNIAFGIIAIVAGNVITCL